MKKAIIFAAFTTLLLLQSCIPSIYPLYSDDTVVFRKEILGMWIKDDMSWAFEKEEGDAYVYKLTFKDEDEEATFEVYLVKLGEHYFFDFFNLSPKYEDTDAFAIAPLIRTHSFARLELSGNQMAVHFFDPSWLEELVKQRKIRIKHETTTNGEIVLTAPTRDLQEFVKKYAGEKGAFTDPTIFERQ